MTDGPEFRVSDAERTRRVLDRMARRIADREESGTRLLGVRRRGVPLAERLARRLSGLGADEVGVEEVVLKRYADDLTLLHERPELQEEPELDVDGRSVWVVDDVLYTGRTLFRAARVAAAAGAGRVQAAVLCSRGPTEVPVASAVTGMRLDVGEDNLVEVHVPPYEEDLGVHVRGRPG